MTVLKRGALAFALAAGSFALANCSGGGSAGGSGGPAPDPTSTPVFTAVPTLAPTGSMTPTPSPSPGGKTTAKPHETPEPTPTPTSGPPGTPGPTATPTASPAPTPTPACSAQNDPNIDSTELSGNQQVIQIPCFQSFRANITLPANNGGGSTPIDLQLEASIDKTLGAPASPSSGTAIYYESFKPLQFALTLQGTTVQANISSKADIVPGLRYAANFFAQGAKIVPTVTGIVPSGNNISIKFIVPQNYTFAANTAAQIVLYQSP